MTILLFVMLGVFVFMMFRRNKKTQQQQTELQSKFGPGVEVMTSFGLFGRIVEIDEEENKVLLELSPGNTATVHRQAVTKVVEPVVAAEEPTVVPDDASALTAGAADSPAAANDTLCNDSTLRNDNTLRNGSTLHNETPDETLRRLNDEGKKDS
jgi:preprotein translocase subunit YajC